jgi:AcrR family transcriptional regulator
MVRWEPGAKDRLRMAALDLFVRQGFEQTTAGEIARSVGLTERTFFRHFTDKREVLFDGQEVLQAAFVDAVAAAPPGEPLELVTAALRTTAEFFPAERRDWSRSRQDVIAANTPLRERELLKMAALSAAVAEALRARGAPEPAATLAAQSGITVFEIAFLQWIADGETRPLFELEREVLATLTTTVRDFQKARRVAPDVR